MFNAHIKGVLIFIVQNISIYNLKLAQK